MSVPALVFLALLLSSCSMAGFLGQESEEGAIALTIGTAGSKTLLPSLDMTPASYDIAGAGPGSRTFSQSTASTSIVIPGLAFGQWTITVSAKNAAGTVIAQGSAPVTVTTGAQTPVVVAPVPLAGAGTLNLSVSWVAADVQTASIDAQLTPTAGSAIPLAFSLASGSATCQNPTIPAGYYTLSLKLLDNGVLVMGAVEVVRIVKGATTAGAFDFTQVNKPGGAISVSIAPQMSLPLTVTMQGQAATLAAGTSMTVTASVSGSPGNVVYVWFVNGESRATGLHRQPQLHCRQRPCRRDLSAGRDGFHRRRRACRRCQHHFARHMRRLRAHSAAGCSLAPAAFMLAALILGLASCTPPTWPQMGALAIQIAEAEPKTLVPGLDMTIATFAISGQGPGGVQFSRSTTDASLTIGGLSFGNWTIGVDGKNAGGTIVAHGGATVKVITGATQAASITVLPLTGPGTLSLSVTWPAAAVGSPSIQSQLIPVQGSATTLAFTPPSAGQATSTTGGIQSGYYTLVIKLLDNGQLVMGAVDVVRIASGATTSGSFAFTDINTGTGSISVSISPRMDAPIAVTLSGQAPELATGTPMTVAASLPSGPSNVTLVWYLNGVARTTGASFTVNTAAAPLAAGTYRIDVTAFSADGTRGGSATCGLRVLGTGQVTLEWDPNTETDLAGYRIYTGSASGVYGATPAWSGTATTCTITGLVRGRTYYFAATARNTAGVESGRSNEVSYAVP